MQKYIPMLARLFLVLIFLVVGVSKIFNFSGTQQYMASVGMPLTGLFLVAAIIIEIGGGLALLIGFKAPITATILIIYLIPTTLIFHTNFAEQAQMIHFLKNIAIIGGLLMTISNSLGDLSLNERSNSV